ncbi:hypothetical protein [Cupriavidus sp. IK-TO18]|uniref:hypothetical protein n=1 Tax=Cupriavidus sp. IK-TO18 TaxID=2782182 RepID=UPI001899603F|nr:hypothetical protein [Cupriavidus sp. IK-TO18]MBF6986910.1 hypothetical protein [Cupriavidus sp. IK-TO18]
MQLILLADSGKNDCEYAVRRPMFSLHPAKLQVMNRLSRRETAPDHLQYSRNRFRNCQTKQANAAATRMAGKKVASMSPPLPRAMFAAVH